MINYKDKYYFLSSKIILVVILCFASVTLNFSDSTGTIVTIVILTLYTLSLKWSADFRFVLIGISIFLIFKLYGFFYIDPITGYDSIRYFALTQSYSDLSSFYHFAFNEIKQYGLFGVSSITFFGVFYMPFFVFFSLETPTPIIVLNYFLTVSTIYLWSKTIEKSFRGNVNRTQKNFFISVFVLISFLSPAISYWSSVFLKDIFSLFLGVLSFYFFTKRRLVFFVIALIIAVAIRPYAIGFVFCFWSIFYLKSKTTLLAALLSSLYVMYEAGITGLINAFPMMLRVLFSPSPFKIENWSNFFFPTLEGAFVMIGLIIILITFINNKESRKIYTSFIFSLFIYSCILTLVGQSAILSKDLDYGLLSAGDDIFRKKLPFTLIIYTVIAYAISTSKTRITFK